jgi:hypothetical protein
MRRISIAAAALAGSVVAAGTVLAADVKVGVVMGLSGPPAIVDFGERSRTTRRPAASTKSTSSSTTTKPTRRRPCRWCSG